MRPRMRLNDAVIDRIRRAPGRVIGSRELNHMGHDSWRLSQWVREGALERLVPGWYRLPGDDAPLQDCHLASHYLRGASCRRPAILTGQAALPTIPWVLVEHGRRVRLPDAPFHAQQRRDVKAVPTRRVADLTVAAAPHALADLVVERLQSDAELRSVLYSARNHLFPPPPELVATWSAMDHRGARELLRLADLGALEHESPAEWNLFTGLFHQHPPPPDCQVYVTPRIRVDFVYLFAGLVIEYFGKKYHADTVDEDNSRIFELRQLGLEVLVVTASMTRDLAALGTHIHQTRRRRQELVLAGKLPRPPLPCQPARLTPLRTLVPLS